MKSSCKINNIDDDNHNQTAYNSSPVFPSRHPLESYPNLLRRCAALASRKNLLSSVPRLEKSYLLESYYATKGVAIRVFSPPFSRKIEKKRKEERRKIPPISERSQSTAACRNLRDYRRRGNVRRLKKQPRVACRSRTLRGCDVISIRVVFLHGLAEGRRGWKRY